MMRILKHSLNICLVVALLLPFSVINASEEDEMLHLEAQLGAIIEYLDRRNGKPNDALSHDELRRAIDGGVAWLLNAQEANGHFKYEYVPYEGRYNDDDNVVRQAGALYVLSEVYRHQTDKNPEVAEAIESSMLYFQSLNKSAEKDDGDFSCAVDPKNGRDCRLGTISLVLTAVLGYVEAEPDKVILYRDLIDDYIAFILTAKKPEEGLRDKYRVGVGWQSKESSFSNSEALLALVRYYQFEPREDVKEVVDDTYDYLAGQEYDSNLYLWMTAALKDMVELWPDKAVEYGIYAKNFTDWRVGRSAYHKNTHRNYCAYTEGIVSAYSVLEGTNIVDEQALLREEIKYWNARNETLQINRTDLFRLTNYDNVLRLSLLDEPNVAHGGFLTSHTNEVQRIDFTQHCVSAYLQTLVDIEGESL